MKPDIACHNHPDVEGFFQCHYCGRNFCERCSRRVEEGFSVCTAPECLKVYEAEAAGPKKPCPHCSHENSPRAFNCGACGKKMPAAPGKDLDSPVVAAKFANLADANLAKAKLENQGIESFVMDEAVGTLYASNSFLGGIRLLTRTKDLEKAQEILGLKTIPLEDFYPQGQIAGICRYCRETLDPSELQEEARILRCQKPQCLDAFQKEMQSLTRFCPSCGAEAPYPIFYCTNCGKKLEKIHSSFEPEWVAAPKLPNTQKPHTPYKGLAGACRYCGEIISQEELSPDPGPLHCQKPECLEVYREEMEKLTRDCAACGARIPYPETVCAKCGAKVPEIQLELVPEAVAVETVAANEKLDLKWVLLLWLTLFSIEIIPDSIYNAIEYQRGVLPSSTIDENFFRLGEISCILLVWYWVKRFRNFSWRDALGFMGFKAPNGLQLLAGVLILLPILVGNYFGYQAFQSTGAPLSLQSDWRSRLADILLGACLFEETIYRGFIFRVLRQGRSFLSAATLSSLFWALSHITHCIPFGGPWQDSIQEMPGFMFGVFLDGLAGTYLFEKGSNNIWGYMLVHLGMDISDLINDRGSEFYASHLPHVCFTMGEWGSLLLTVPVTMWVLRNRMATSRKDVGEASANKKGNELSRNWAPGLLFLVFSSALFVLFFLSSAVKLSKAADDKQWEKFMDFHPRYADGYRRWASALWDMGEKEEAAERSWQTVVIDPKNYRAWLLWGRILNYQHHYDEAEKKLQKAAECAPKNAANYLWWGWVLEKDKKNEEAIEKYRKALSLNPDETSFTAFAAYRIDKLEARK